MDDFSGLANSQETLQVNAHERPILANIAFTIG
jgi:hypothetical protein